MIFKILHYEVLKMYQVLLWFVAIGSFKDLKNIHSFSGYMEHL